MSGSLRDEYIRTLRVPTDANVWLRLWEIALTDESDETRTAVIPAEVATDYFATVWEGDVVFEHQTGQTENDKIAVVTGGSKIQLQSGPTARVAILGIEHRFRAIPYPRRSGAELPGGGIPNGEATFFLRELEFDEGDDPLPIESWDRPGFLLTTVDGPRLGTELPEPGPCTGNQLDFDTLRPMEDVTLVRGRPCAPLAWILDIWVEGDSYNPRVLVDTSVIQNGCKIRCWGGGPIG